MARIAGNLDRIRARIAAACDAARRDPAGVTLLAVSKTVLPDAVLEALACGQHCFGENYVQEALAKIRLLCEHAGAESSSAAPPRTPIEWHCIGPIQSNKTRLVAEHFDWVQTIDRLRIAERLSAQRPAGSAPLQVCVQVNIDGGPNKAGAAPEEAEALAQAVAALPHLQLRGLMTIPEPVPDFAAQRAVHERARALFERIAGAGGRGFERFDTLSMGMTADLEAAIHAGSTMVRVGTGIFGARA
ncbi:MAG: Pyridoxal phosphate-containing protein YggS [Burkholderiaceae bacterium]|jgi:pyridoxal phosphate enzyme (YggS family)|nr:MAG: Pyridoxal phosphate-containing protein YggS [Burkholderiaceae bacterium]